MPSSALMRLNRTRERDPHARSTDRCARDGADCGSEPACLACSQADGSTPATLHDYMVRHCWQCWRTLQSERQDVDHLSRQRALQAPQLPRQPPAMTAFGVTSPLPQPSTLLGIPLTGTVDLQFDAGYFVTIHAGTQEFRGRNMTSEPRSLVTSAVSQVGVSGGRALERGS